MKLITTALITAKAQFNPIHKNKVNPHFKSRYATLDEILEAIAPALLANNLLLIQPTIVKDNLTVLKTILIHAESGKQLISKRILTIKLMVLLGKLFDRKTWGLNKKGRSKTFDLPFLFNHLHITLWRLFNL